MTLPPRVEAVNVGLATFADALREQGAPVIEVDWRPPADGDPSVLAVLERLWGAHGDRVSAANERVVERLEEVSPCAVGVEPADAVVPGLRDGMLLHSGPPIPFAEVCDPQRRALLAAVVFEGWADDRSEAERMLAAGEIALEPGNEHDHVGPMTGVCSPSMPVWIVEGGGARAFSTLNEGPGRTLWFGVADDEAVERLRFFRDDLGPTLARLLEHRGPVDVLSLAGQGLNMGDELHMRSQATGNLLIRDLLTAFAARGGEAAARFVAGNHHFFLNLTMAACKCAWLAAGGVPGSNRHGRSFHVARSSHTSRMISLPPKNCSRGSSTSRRRANTESRIVLATSISEPTRSSAAITVRITFTALVTVRILSASC